MGPLTCSGSEPGTIVSSIHCTAPALAIFRRVEGACACGAFADTVGTYSAKRTASLKGDNPLAGAGTMANTCLVLDRVSMADFKTVVISAIEAAETPAFTWPVIPMGTPPMPPVPQNYTDPAVKHIRWDFGPQHLGCVIKADLNQDSSTWVRRQGIEVSMVKTGAAAIGHGRQQYQYCVYHLRGDV